MLTQNGSSATLYAVWKVNSYAVTIAKSGSGLTLGSTSVSPNYGSYATVTITPSSGYYISAASCNDSGYSVKTTSGTTPSFGTAASPTYTSATTFRIYNNSSTATGKTCTFTGAARTFTVTVSVSNASRSSASVSVSYGSNNTVTITPSSGYYLSGASCTNGYTTNAGTGTSTVSAQTVTISNNSKVANSTCSFTATALTPAQACANISVGGTAVAGGNTYRKVSSGHCWAFFHVLTPWASAASHCPSGTAMGNYIYWAMYYTEFAKYWPGAAAWTSSNNTDGTAWVVQNDGMFKWSQTSPCDVMCYAT